ncbi:hypothetical protein GCM10028822_00330 [Hymenobacter terrigena]
MTRHFYALSCLALFLLSSCETLTKHRLSGTYYRSDKDNASAVVQKLRLTNSKFILTMPLNGDMAMDYSVENGIIYVGGQPSQMCFTIDGLGIISNKGNLGIEGTYIKQTEQE